MRSPGWGPIAAVVLATACGAARLPAPRLAGQPTDALVPVPYPPPAAHPESIPPRPADDAVWIDGEWRWQTRRWAWHVGRWVRPPAGARYSPWTSTRDENGTVLVAAGVWRDGQGNVIADPPPLSVAFGGDEEVLLEVDAGDDGG